MKAVYCTQYGGPEVLEIRDVPRPVPKDDEILVNVHATTVNSGDTRIQTSRVPKGFGIPLRLMFGIFKPRNLVLGINCTGQIEAVGSKVTKFASSDHVVVAPGASLGCHAEYCLVSEKKAAIAPIPDGISFEDAAAVIFGGTTALSFLRDRARLKAGETVLVNGASGAVGLSGRSSAASITSQNTVASQPSGNDSRIIPAAGNDVSSATMTIAVASSGTS